MGWGIEIEAFGVPRGDVNGFFGVSGLFFDTFSECSLALGPTTALVGFLLDNITHAENERLL